MRKKIHKFGTVAQRRRFYGDKPCPFTQNCDGYNGMLKGRLRASIGVGLDEVGNFADYVHCFVCGQKGYIDTPQELSPSPKTSALEPQICYVEPAVYQRSIDVKEYDKNNFAKYCIGLAAKLGKDYNTAATALQKLGLGTTRNGDAVFWLIDFSQNIRTARVTKYSPDGKRSRNPNETGIPPPQYRADKGYRQCCFGEHLLAKYPNYPVIVVEAEKSAIVGSMFYYWHLKKPVIFVATNGTNGCKLPYDKLAERVVKILPDVGVTQDVYANVLRELKLVRAVAEFIDPKLFYSLSPFKIDPAKLKSGFDIADAVEAFLAETPASNKPQPEPLTLKPKSSNSANKWPTTREVSETNINTIPKTENGVELKQMPLKQIFDIGKHSARLRIELNDNLRRIYYFEDGKTANEIVEFFMDRFGLNIDQSASVIETLVSKNEIESNFGRYFHKLWQPF